MGDIKTITATIVSTLEGDTGITADILTAGAGTLDQVLASEDTQYPAVLVTYEGGEYAEHTMTAQIVDTYRTWRVYTIVSATSAASDVAGDAADLLERVVADLLGVTVDSGRGELWPVNDELVYSSRGTVAYSVDFITTTRMAGL